MLDTLEKREKVAPPSTIIENLTDVGNGKRLAQRHEHQIRYLPASGKWLYWDGTRWATDDTGYVVRLAKETVVAMYSEASGLRDANDRGRFVVWALKSEGVQRLDAMVKMARSEKSLIVKPEQLDANPWLLNLLNCTIELKPWAIGENDPDDLITRRIPIKFDKHAKCPVWNKFIARILGDNAELIDFVQRAVGYTLTGATSEQVLFFMFGTGRNGKSTFIETIQKLLGEYVVKTPTETLMARDGQGVSNDIARLAGRRMVVASETDEGQRLAEKVVKDLTGGDKITARFLHQEFFEFTPAFKLWLYGNHMPIIKGTDEGIWRRIRIIPFRVTIPKEEVDPDLQLKLIDELPGILNWALIGCKAWIERGLGDPLIVHEATADYRGEMDVLGTFIDELCTVGAEQSTAAKDLYKAYSDWCIDYGERAMAQRQLGLRLKERGFTMRKGSGGVRLWDGIGVPLRKIADL